MMSSSDVIVKGVWLGLGSNLGNSLDQIRYALRQLDQNPDIKVVRASDAYRTAAVGVGEQPDFINGVAELEVTLSAALLLECLLALEHQMGRRRSGLIPQARCIDLDLLLYGDQVLNSEHLTVPHPRMHQRAFVLAPLHDLCPALVIPGQRRALEYLQGLDDQLVEHLNGVMLWQG